MKLLPNEGSMAFDAIEVSMGLKPLVTQGHPNLVLVAPRGR